MILAATTLTYTTPSVAGPVNIFGSFGDFNLAPQSRKEMRWNTVVRQQYDFSCGSAAVATLMSYHYDRPTTEPEVFQSMYQKGNQEKIKKHGFSMLDMKRYLDNQGLRADGFKMSLDQFIEIGVPGITLVNTGGYNHFVVVKGVSDSHVLVGDPAAGVMVVPKTQFESIWNGSVLAAREQVQIARANFNNQRDWQVRPPSPLNSGVNRSGLSSHLLTLPGRFEQGR